jgi:putative ABC transport system permease protein
MPDDAANDVARSKRWADDVRRRLAAVRLDPAREAEVVDELSQHLEDRFRELTAAGAPAEDAAHLALAEFRDGDVLAQYMAPLRQAHAPAPITPGAPTGTWLTDAWQNLRYATRTFRKQPAFAAASVLTLALGIGATTAIFSVVYGVLLKPLPFNAPEELVSIKHHAPHGAGTNHGPGTYLTYSESQRTFEGIGAWDPTEVSVTGRGDPERVQALLVTASTLPLLRVEPALGRRFDAEDDTPGNPLRVILTHGYWQRRFGGAADVVGQSLMVDGRPREILGVLPPSFTFLHTRPDILLPLPLDAAAPRWIGFGFQALARLKPGTTLAQANADVGRLIGLLPPVFARLELQPNVRPLADDVIGDIGGILWILLAAVGVVWLIACGNVANLFLVRAEGRHQEFATRAALGASRVRVAFALLTESMVLALAGGIVGVGLAALTTRILRAIAPASLPRVEDIGIDATVLLFTLGITLLSGVLFGVLAVMRFSTPSLATLREGGRFASDAPGRHRTRNALVVGQVALALTLLIVCGLMVRTFVAMRQVDPGFTRPQDVQTFVVAIPPGLIDDDDQAARTFEQAADRLSGVPGVNSVGLSSSVTMDGEDNGNTIAVEGFSIPEGQPPPLRRFKSFAPGYFETMGIPLVAGRSVTWSEIHEQRPVIVVSESLARVYWGEPAKALGKRIRASQPDAAWREIVGVTGGERDDGLIHPPTAIVYWPMLNENYRWRTMAFVVRSNRVGTPGFLSELAQAVWSVNPQLPLANVQTLAAIQALSMTQTSFALVMLGIAAGVALLIAVVGIYGVVAYVAAQRTRETGLRIALGAQSGDIRTMFVRHGLSLSAIGIVAGIVLALGVTRVMSAFLFGVESTDLLTYMAVSAGLTGITLLATYLPARRAARVDPLIALRAEA